MSKVDRKKQRQKLRRRVFTIINTIVVLFMLSVVHNVFKNATNYFIEEKVETTNVIINNINISKELVNEVFIDGEKIYLSKEDIEKFIDPNIYYEQQYNLIITGGETKIAEIEIGSHVMKNNGSTQMIDAVIIEKNDTYYIPINVLSNIYNIDIKYLEQTDIIVIDFLSKKFTVGEAKKKLSIKSLPKTMSRTIEKVEKTEELILVEGSNIDGWIEVRTKTGTLGYIKETNMVNIQNIREDMFSQNKFIQTPKIQVDYYASYSSAPIRTESLSGINVVSPAFLNLTRLGQGSIDTNVSLNYIEWAKENNFEIWALISNNGMVETTSEILNDYMFRQELIENIYSNIVRNNLDGININFREVYLEDKEMFSRFMIELEPRLNEIGAVLVLTITSTDELKILDQGFDMDLLTTIVDYIEYNSN